MNIFLTLNSNGEKLICFEAISYRAKGFRYRIERGERISSRNLVHVNGCTSHWIHFAAGKIKEQKPVLTRRSSKGQRQLKSGFSAESLVSTLHKNRIKLMGFPLLHHRSLPQKSTADVTALNKVLIQWMLFDG